MLVTYQTVQLERILVFSPIRGMMIPLYAVLSVVLLLVSISYFKDLLTYVGVAGGLSFFLAVQISFLSLVLSPVNLVIKEVKRRAFVPEIEVVYVFGFPVYVPRLERTYATTLLAINVGGAVIPTALSLVLTVLLSKFWTYLLVDILLTVLVSRLFSRVVRGVGVVMNPFVAPFFSVMFSFILFSRFPLLVPVTGYISSVLGTLVGADLLNLNKVLEASPQVVSIGGMGSFDGIFLSGLLSIILGQFIVSVI